jgi:hypothetical protein
MVEAIQPKLKKMFVYRELNGEWHRFGSSFAEADLTRRKAQEAYHEAIKRRSSGERKPSWKIIEVDDDVNPPSDIAGYDIQGYTIIAQN